MTKQKRNLQTKKIEHWIRATPLKFEDSDRMIKLHNFADSDSN